MKKLVCQMGMIFCLLGMMLAVGSWVEGMNGFWGTVCVVGLLAGAQVGLVRVSGHRQRRSRAKHPAVVAQMPAAKKRSLRAA